MNKIVMPLDLVINRQPQAKPHANQIFGESNFTAIIDSKNTPLYSDRKNISDVAKHE